MIKLQDGRVIIGVDTGYEYCKTATQVFKNGVHSMGQSETTLLENTLFYNGFYYKVGEDRTLITDDKISDENTRLLTMVAIAKELMNEGIVDADIILAVGLPFSNYGRDKKELIAYYMREPDLSFEFEGIMFRVRIDKVLCFPQGYSAVASRLASMQDTWIVIDIGSKTTDLVVVEDGFPKESKSLTLEKALIKWIKEIQTKLQIHFGKSIPEKEVISVMEGRKSFLPDEYVRFIKTNIKEQVSNFELDLAERGYDMRYSRIMYVGGGATVMKNYVEVLKPNVYYDTDTKVNAKGYEFLAYSIVLRG